MYENLTKVYYKNHNNHKKIYEARFTSEATVKLPLQIKAWKGSVYQLFYLNTPKIMSLISNIYSKIIENNTLYTSLCSEEANAFIKYYWNEMLIDEINATNNIEGIRSTRKDLEEAMQHVKVQSKKPRFHYVVKKYLNLQENSTMQLNDSKDLRVMYDEFILNEIAKESKPDGKYFRKEAVSVLDFRGNTKEVHHGIQGETEIINHINQLLSYMNDVNESPLLIKIAVFQYYFGYVHPFYDGNGRVSRYLMSHYLKNIDPLMSFKVSKIILDNINTYYKLFDETNQDLNRGDLTPFITEFLGFFLQGVEEQNVELSKYNMLFNNFKHFINNDESVMSLPKYALKVLFIIYQASIYGNQLSNADLQSNTKSGYRKVKIALDELVDKNLIERESYANYKMKDEVFETINN